MNNVPQTCVKSSERRQFRRYDLNPPLLAELIYESDGPQLATGQVFNVSHGGMGIRSSFPLALLPGTPIRVALAQNKIWKVKAEVVLALNDNQIGVKVASDERQALINLVGSTCRSATALLEHESLMSFRTHQVSSSEMYATPNAHLSTGIGVIDEQHEVLIELLNALLQCQNESLNSERATEIISNIGKHIMEHFEYEENHMRNSCLPKEELRQHIFEHNRILAEYSNLQFEIMDHGNNDVITIVHLVRNWIIDHIVSYDLGLLR